LGDGVTRSFYFLDKRKMLTFYQDFLNILDEHHKNIAQAIEGIPQEALDWLPGEGMNSISVLIVHLTGAERYWIGDVASGDVSSRDRAGEFRMSGIACGALQQRLADATAYAHSVLTRLTADDLEQKRISARDGRKFTVGWALLHALEHTALHLGHIQITRQLWDGQRR
jgi:uncharacterized damage-inducible protein DinB